MDRHAARLQLFARTNQLREAEGWGEFWDGAVGLHYGFSSNLSEYAEKQGTDLWKVLDAYRAALDNFTVADVGCGRGDALREVKKRFGNAVRTVGFDVARLHAHATLDVFVKGDFEQIAVPEDLRGACHVIVSDQVFEYMQQPLERGLSQVNELLAPEGQAYIDMCHSSVPLSMLSHKGVYYVTPRVEVEGIPQKLLTMSHPRKLRNRQDTNLNYSLFD